MKGSFEEKFVDLHLDPGCSHNLFDGFLLQSLSPKYFLYFEWDNPTPCSAPLPQLGHI